MICVPTSEGIISEKDEATESTLKGLLDAKFISKEKYTDWLSNVILVKKT